MKSPVFSDLIRFKRKMNALPEKDRRRVLPYFTAYQRKTYNDFKNWEVELVNCLDFLDCKPTQHLFNRWRSKLFPRDPYNSAILIQKTLRIYAKKTE